MRILGINGLIGSGKNTLCNFMHGYQLRANNLIQNFSLDIDGKLHVAYDEGKEGMLDVERNDPQFALWAVTGLWPYVKSYAFAHALKDICENLFEIPRECLYGTDQEKNAIIPNLLWENIPGIYTNKKMYDLSVEANPELKSILCFHDPGPMTAREFMQFFGTEVMRKIYSPIWVNRCIRLIKEEESALAIITDVRFDNEAEAILGAGGKVVQLTRTTKTDGHTSEKGISPALVSTVLDNANMDLVDSCQQLLNIIDSYGWTE